MVKEFNVEKKKPFNHTIEECCSNGRIRINGGFISSMIDSVLKQRSSHHYTHIHTETSKQLEIYIQK